ncbi:MAG: hypothetical protein HS115_00475 [Spirochaetales bacterium]|nr:hypothetical protein [Spirochaetales bacterium]
MQYQWLEIEEGKKEFIKIVDLLVRFDEKTHRHQQYAHPEMHWMRRAIVAASTEDLRVFINPLSEWLYYIVVELKAQGHFLATAWMHEDGIFMERREAPADHPVHQITCMHDLACLARPLPLDLSDSLIDGASLELMESGLDKECA